MNNPPLVSILINNYNYARFLRESIDSALNQTYSHIEVIVVDDGSKDNSQEVIKSYGDRIVSVFKKNGGQASAFNAGFANSHGEIICFLDADDYYSHSKIHEVVELFKQHSEAQWLFHQLEDVDVDGKSLQINRNQDITDISFVDFSKQILKGKNIPFLPATSALCFQRDLLSQFLPMPEQLLISADNFLRLAAIYLSPGLLSPAQLAVHRIHGKNLFESRPNHEFLIAETNIQTCYYLRQKFPETRLYTNRIYAHAVGRLAGKTNITKILQIPEFKQYMHKYFSFEFGLTTFPRIFYNYVKAVIIN